MLDRVPATGGERHEVDLLARARLADTDAFFLIHVENQATRQPEFGQRMFRYFARLHEKYNLPVYPVALFSYDRPRLREPDHYEVKFPDRRVLLFRYRVIQLNRLNWRDFLRKPSPVAAALMTKMKIAPTDRQRLMLECLRMIVTLKLDLARSALIRNFMMSYLRLTREEEVVYNRQLSALESTEKRPIVELMDVFTARRFRNGIVLALEHRFGTVPPQTREGIENLPAESLEGIFVALLDFKGIADADAWMAQHQS